MGLAKALSECTHSGNIKLRQAGTRVRTQWAPGKLAAMAQYISFFLKFLSTDSRLLYIPGSANTVLSQEAQHSE
jgi:hypothetical protein